METLDIVKAALNYLSCSSTVYGLSEIASANNVSGERQSCDCVEFDHEYVDQQREYDGSCNGYVYLPLPNGEYLKMFFYDY